LFAEASPLPSATRVGQTVPMTGVCCRGRCARRHVAARFRPGSRRGSVRVDRPFGRTDRVGTTAPKMPDASAPVRSP